MGYQPPYSLNEAILRLVAEIAQKVGKIEAYDQLDRSPHLRKQNRIKTIHSSLAIEHNSLSLDQVTAVLEGKHVIAPSRDLLEVQNAVATYEVIEGFDATSVDDLLRAHRMLMRGLVSEPGCFRSGNVGVFDGDELIHAGTPAAYVPQVVGELFDWMRDGSSHPLVTSCVFHYEFEFIHPFQDGNGRMGRLWQSVILGSWNPLFYWLPVESLVKEQQAMYYAVLGQSDAESDSTRFIEFMLTMISSALDDMIDMMSDGDINDGISVGITNEATSTQERVLALFRSNPTMTLTQLADELDMSKRQAERLVAGLKEAGRLARVGARKKGRWEVRD